MGEEISELNTLREQDAALIKAFLSGQAEAFDKLVIRYQHRVFNVCYRFLGHYEDARDCAQEVFIKAYRSLKNFGFESAFYTWLYRIAVNTCITKLSSAEHRHKKGLIELDAPRQTQDGTHTREVGDESLSPRKAFEQKERMGIIQKAIDALPQEQKIVVVLRDIERLSYEEIVQITGYNLGTVKSKLSRARQQLKETLLKEPI